MPEERETLFITLQGTSFLRPLKSVLNEQENGAIHSQRAAKPQVAWAQWKEHCSHWAPLHSQFVLSAPTNKCIKYAEQ